MSELTFYEPFAFNSSSLKRLGLYQNREMKANRMDVDHMFKHCPNLEKLSIVNTKLGLRKNAQIWRLLAPLTSLTTLHLERIGRGLFPEDLLWRMPKLEKLNLAVNSFSSANLGRALRKVTSVRYLNVRANDITLVNESTLPWPFRQHLTNLDLSHNPFSCECDMRWFQRWLEDVKVNKSVKVYGYGSGNYYVCQTPERRKGVPVMAVRFTEEECQMGSWKLTLGVSVGGVLATLCLLAAVLYRYRWYVRFYLYRYRRRRQDGKGTKEPFQFDFDVYLAHSPEDVHWVMEQLLPVLEEDHGLRAFLPDRDTELGTVMADNITRFMDISARILLLISDSYVREQWRLFEFQHIVYAAVDQQKDVIVVLLGDVESGRMTKEMTRMLTRGTFLQWGSSDEAQRVFREGLRVALKTEDNSFQTIC